jgi:hypothetical protein
MTFIEQLQSHIGNLILLKNRLYWYSSNSCDEIAERTCLLLDVRDIGRVYMADGARVADADGEGIGDENGPAALLLVDGKPTWVWISSQAVELL